MLARSPRKARAGKELFRVPEIFRSRLGDDLFQMDGKLIRVERPAFPDFLSRCGNSISRQHCYVSD